MIITQNNHKYLGFRLSRTKSIVLGWLFMQIENGYRYFGFATYPHCKPIVVPFKIIKPKKVKEYTRQQIIENAVIEMSKSIKKYGVTKICFNIWEERNCNGQSDGIQADLDDGTMLFTPALDLLVDLVDADKAYGFLSVMFPLADVQIDRIDITSDHDELSADDQVEEDLDWDEFINDSTPENFGGEGVNILTDVEAMNTPDLCETCDDVECIAHPHYAEQIDQPLAM